MRARLQATKVSRQHLKFEWTGHDWVLRCYGKNGGTCNKRTLPLPTGANEPAGVKLRHKDAITVEGCKFFFLLPQEPNAPAAGEAADDLVTNP